MPGKLGGLIELAREQPRGMQRHTHDGIAVGQHLPAGPGHPARHHRRQVGAIAVFEVMHQIAGDALVHRDTAQPVEHRWMGDRFGRQHAGARIMTEGRTEHLAIGTVDEPDRRPAAGAKRAVATGSAMAVGTAWRKDDVAQDRCRAEREREADGKQFLHYLTRHGVDFRPMPAPLPERFYRRERM